ncbi:hypothetical protein WA026_020270 [Henosepilachna vigintioctopunctata]|uniref:Uncharacterized protein n=1 Tax=Henosepilachna vigintioctopunctata TaxID=420089 RepID=A0AAW1TRG1_9CUCU
MNEAQECDYVNRIIRFAHIGMSLTPMLIRRFFSKRHPEIPKRKIQFNKPARAHKLNRPIRKAINYKDQRVTKSLFKEQETLNEHKMKRKTTQKNYKRKTKESEKKTENEKKKRSYGNKRKRSNLWLEESWFCPGSNENCESYMRQCAKCRKWYHEECEGLTKNDEVFLLSI